nr:MAG TPA: hypothetical protein [Caudoviricetes sp.]
MKDYAALHKSEGFTTIRKEEKDFGLLILIHKEISLESNLATIHLN